MAQEDPTVVQHPVGEPRDNDASTSEVVGEPSSESVVRPVITSDAALTFPQARGLTGRRGARLVLLMGETGAGKATLIVEAWTRLVAHGPLGDHRLAGSRTALAFEERAFLSRLEAGTSRPDTLRTQEEDDGLLHLRIARPDLRLVELLLADYSGEHFERIRQGAELLEELPWAGRADRLVVFLDGAAIGSGGGELELALNHACRQLLALESAGGIAPTARLAIALVKDDLHSDDALKAAQPRVDHMLQIARNLDPEAELVAIAARPANGSDPWGLDGFIKWLALDDRAAQIPSIELPIPARAIARIRA